MKLTDYLAPAAAPILPWALLGLVLAWGGSLAGVAWWAHSDGAAAPKAQCEADKANALAEGFKAMAAEVKHAAAVGADIADAMGKVTAAQARARERARAVVEETNHEVDQAPDLARAVLPARVRELRDQQVSDSAAAAAIARDLVRTRSRAGRAPGAGPGH